MRPPGFNQPTHQNNNQNRFQGNNFNQNQNRQPNQGAIYQNRPQQNPNFQAPSQQNTVTQGKFEAYTTANDANMNNLQLKSGMSYKERPIPPPGVDQQEPIEVTTDTELPSPKDIQPPFADALVHMPKFALMFKKLLNKDKLIELTKTPLNENCSVEVLKKLLEKLGDPGRFLIPCDFLEFNNCLALADLGASINLMPLSIWKKLRLPTLNDMKMEKSHFMVKEGIVLGYKISKKGIEDFSKISRPMTHLLEKNSHFISNECIQAFRTLTEKLTEAPILIAPNWDQPFELMCDASDYAVGAVLRKRVEKHFRPIYYASKTMNQVETNYITTEKEMLAVVYTFEKFRSYLIMNKSIVYTNHSALKYLFAKKDAKARLLPWILLLQEFEFKVIYTRGAENYAADHLSRLENPYENVFDPKEINEAFPLESLNKFSHQDPSTPWFGDFANYHAGKFIIKVDYLSKWVEAKALPTNDARVVVKFLKSLFSRFGTPKAIINDRGTHFCNDLFARVMSKYGVTHRLSTAYHPQTSRHVEVTNRGLKRILKRTVRENRALWSDKLEYALWAFRTEFKTPVGCTPYRLKIFSSKLKSRWSGPFTISEIYPYGTAKLVHPDGCNFKVNCHRLKHYHGGNPPPLEISDVQTFPKDN
nr:hypothetical protein [Tanacetum cinerariifolium]